MFCRVHVEQSKRDEMMLLAVTSPCVAALFPSESPKACREALCTRMPSRFITLLPAVTAQMQSNTATTTTRPAALLQRTSHTRTHTLSLTRTLMALLTTTVTLRVLLIPRFSEKLPSNVDLRSRGPCYHTD